MSAISLCVCAEIGGRKRNVEVAFPQPLSTVPVLLDQLVSVFSSEFAADLQLAREHFDVDFVVAFDDATRQWRPLEGVEWLRGQDQLYIFQPHRPREAISEIPPPNKLVFAPPPRAMDERSLVGRSGVDIRKVEELFQDMDINHNDFVSLEEMGMAFTIGGVEFSAEAQERMFKKCDVDCDGELSWEEFRLFAEVFPNTTETLYWRVCQLPSEASDRAIDINNELKELRRRKGQLRQQMLDCDNEIRSAMSRMKQERGVAREMDPRRRLLEEEEQDLMNTEFALQFHRDMVIQAESRFAHTSVKFDNAAVHQGSPRRARPLV